MHKRILFFILVILVAFTGINTTFAVDKSVQPLDYAYDFAKGTANTLGVTFNSDDASSVITRGEFVSAMVALSGMSGISGGEVPYADITSNSPYYSAIKTAYTLSWISDAKLFNPDDAITYIQALKIGVHAIGGEYQAAFYGSYPTGYSYLANTLDLTEGIYSDYNSVLTLRDAYVLLYNIISSKTFSTSFVDKGDVSISYGAASILEKQHEMFVHEGVLVANSVTNLYDEFDNNRDKIRVGNEEFIDESGLMEYVGYNVKLLYSKNGNKKYARYIIPYETNVVTLNNHDIINFQSNTVYYSVGEKEEKIQLKTSYSYIYNGKTTILTTNDLTNILNSESAMFAFIDNDNDRKYDVLSVKKYEYTFVGKFDLYDGVIYDANSNETLIDLSGDGCKFTVSSYEDGNFIKSTLKSISNGVVIASAVSTDKKFVDIIICKDSIQGAVSETTSEGEIVIEGKKYSFSGYYNKYYKYNVGETVTFCLGLNGEIVAESGARSSLNYGFLIDSYKETGLNKDILLKIFDQNGDILILSVSEKVKLDSVSKTANDIYNYAQSLTTDKDKFIRYGVNEDKKVNRIDTAENKINDVESYGNDNYDDNSLALNIEGKFLARGGKIFQERSTLKSKFNYASTKYIFVVPKEDERDDEKLYRIADTSEFVTNDGGKILDLLCYDVDNSGSPSAILVVGGYLQTVDGAASYGVVEKVSASVNDEGEQAHKIYLCDTSSYKTIFLSSETAGKYFIPAPGDIVGYTVNSQNDVTYLTKYFDFQKYKVNDSYTQESDETAIVSGFVYSNYGGYMNMLPAEMKTQYLPVCPENIDFSNIRNLNYAHSSTIYIDAVRSSDGSQVISLSINPSPATKFKDIKTSGKNNATFVVNKLSYNSVKQTFAYNVTYK